MLFIHSKTSKGHLTIQGLKRGDLFRTDPTGEEIYIRGNRRDKFSYWATNLKNGDRRAYFGIAVAVIRIVPVSPVIFRDE